MRITSSKPVQSVLKMVQVEKKYSWYEICSESIGIRYHVKAELLHFGLLFKSRVMPRFVRRGKIRFVPLFCIHRRNRHEDFNSETVLLLKK